jgi:hypothetical protein
MFQTPIQFLNLQSLALKLWVAESGGVYQSFWMLGAYQTTCQLPKQLDPV